MNAEWVVFHNSVQNCSVADPEFTEVLLVGSKADCSPLSGAKFGYTGSHSVPSWLNVSVHR